MKRLSAILAVAAVIGLVSAAAYAAEGERPARTRPTMGELTKIEGKVLTITVKREGADPTEQKATVDDKTEISTEAAAKLADLKVGDRVRITQGDKRFFGEITKIEGKTLTLKGRRDEQTVTVDDSTTIMARVKAKFEDLKVGQQVSVSIVDGKAVRVDVRAPRPKPAEGAK